MCAAGLQGSTADDVAKETAIFNAHKATSIVVCDEGQTRFSVGMVIEVPVVDPALGFILSATAATSSAMKRHDRSIGRRSLCVQLEMSSNDRSSLMKRLTI